LIQARIVGAKASRGRVLTFLDSHCEVTFGWLEPLLARIHEGITHVVSPVIDIIDKNDMKYTPANPNIKGGFGHNLQFKWDQLDTVELQERQRDHTSPIMTPAIAGGLFAIDKSYFEHIGMYDEQMEIWGGENVEISMRIWMCGGTLEIMPCSRVGHIFRSTMPYTFGRGKTYHSTVTKNFRRTAEVWMDNYKHLFYETNPYAIYVSYGNISSRVELRKRLKCKSFEWYINEIYPEFVSGSKQEVVKLSGHLHQDIGCLQTLKDSLRTITIDNCTKSNKIWTFTNNGRIKYLSLCLTVSNPIFPTDVYLATCSNDSLKANQLFEWYKVNSTQNITIMIKHKSSGNCLITKSTNESFQHNKILLSKCNSEEKYHQWLL
jgi:polypeptide N-acetylgalactosaminyltransferase